jgi:hypothetical protein
MGTNKMIAFKDTAWYLWLERLFKTNRNAGNFEEQLMRGNHDRFRIERDEDCR